MAGPRGVRSRHRPGPRAAAPVDRHLVPVRAVLEERRVLLAAGKQDDQLPGVVRRVSSGADMGQQSGKDGGRVHQRPAGTDAPHDHRPVRRFVHGPHRQAGHRAGSLAVLQHAVERVRLHQSMHASSHGGVLVDLLLEPARPARRAQVLAVV